jgi:hypothetical protein
MQPAFGSRLMRIATQVFETRERIGLQRAADRRVQ